jgi:hypothetical protein
MKTIKLSYEGYLTEKKLIQLFKDLEKQTDLIKIETNVKIDKYRGDIVINDYWLVEFDGYRHYTEADVIYRDRHKDFLWASHTDNYDSVIRIPYFIQLTTQTFKDYFQDFLKKFKINVKIEQNYKHGFIDKKAVLPANFCSLGERIFISNLFSLKENVLKETLESLWDKLHEKDAIQIFPLILREIKEFNSFLTTAQTEIPESFQLLPDYFLTNEYLEILNYSEE